MRKMLLKWLVQPRVMAFVVSIHSQQYLLFIYAVTEIIAYVWSLPIIFDLTLLVMFLFRI